MRSLLNNPNVDSSDLINYPSSRIKDNTGAGDGTAVSERTKGDIHQFFEKVMRLYGIESNEMPDNETNGFQLVDAVRALASKNDFILTLGSTAGVLTVPVKLGLMLSDESIICLASVNLASETQIKGSDGVAFNIASFGSFKANEYVRLVKTGSNITLVRIADSISLDLMAGEFLYLKKASQSQENAGAVDTVATTPLVNKVTFIRRVNGADSGSYLASASQNGIYPQAHFNIVAALGVNRIRNQGWFSGINISVTTGALATSGDLSAAVASTLSGNSTAILVTMTNAMTNTNYKVSFDVESDGILVQDTDCMKPVFEVVSTTQFRCAIRENSGLTQSLKIHFEAIQL